MSKLHSTMTDELKARIAEMTPRLQRFAYVLCGSADEAEDLTQSSIVRALSRLDQFTPGTRLESWLFRIMETTWIDRLRALRRRRNAAPKLLTPASDEGASMRRTEDRLDIAWLRGAVAKLPAEQRAVILLIAIGGVTYRQAANRLNVPLGTVMSRLARARKNLIELRSQSESCVSTERRRR